MKNDIVEVVNDKVNFVASDTGVEDDIVDVKVPFVVDDFVESGGSDVVGDRQPEIEISKVDTNFYDLESQGADEVLGSDRENFDNYVQSGNECGGTSVAAPAEPTPTETFVAFPEPVVDIEPPIDVPVREIGVDDSGIIDAIIALTPNDIDFNIVDAPVTEPVAITPPAVIESPIDLTDPIVDAELEPIVDPFVNDAVDIQLAPAGTIDAVAIYAQTSGSGYGDLPSVDDILVVEQDDLLVDTIEPPPSTHIEVEMAVIIEPEPVLEVGISMPVGIADLPDQNEFFVDVN